jgi:hypothetical protein
LFGVTHIDSDCFFPGSWQLKTPSTCTSWQRSTITLKSGARAMVEGRRMSRNVPYKSQTC